jgi:hypothetical protein
VRFAGIALLASAGLAVAQGGDAQGVPNQSATARYDPLLNPIGEIVSWDGKNWDADFRQAFQARFETYLEAPPQTTESDRAYQAIISDLIHRLASAQATPQSLDEAFRLLLKAFPFPQDDHRCQAIAFNVLALDSEAKRKVLAFIRKSGPN